MFRVDAFPPPQSEQGGSLPAALAVSMLVSRPVTIITSTTTATTEGT